MRGAIPSLPQYVFVAWCLVKHRDIFNTFFVYLTSKNVVASTVHGLHSIFCLSITGLRKRFPFLPRIFSINTCASTEHHAMNAYWGSGGMAPRVLDLCTRWRWVISFTPRPLYLQGKSPWYPLDRRLGGTQNRSRRGGEEENSIIATAGNWTLVPLH
jgi:hypothetical protein